MIGLGIGIVLFCLFMQECDVQGVEGKNWLFFGNFNFIQDFLYQLEWQVYVKSGLLSCISLVFFCDQVEKIYVQDCLLEEGKDVFVWLEEGVYVYVCGDVNCMVKDVENVLLDIIKIYGNKDDLEVKVYLLVLCKVK